MLTLVDHCKDHPGQIQIGQVFEDSSSVFTGFLHEDAPSGRFS